MNRNQTIKKLLVITLTSFIILTIVTIPMIKKENSSVLRTNLEIADITNIETDSIYLLNKDHYLVKTEVFIEETTIKEEVKKIIEYLKVENKSLPSDLNGYIPKNIRLLDCQIEDQRIILNFSKELKEQKNWKTIVTGISNSIIENIDINKVIIQVEQETLYEYSSKEINTIYDITSRENITKIVLYYLDKTNTYYVPITKYINDKREKVEIIVEELKHPQENLISLINNKIVLKEYREESNVLYLNFNQYLQEEKEVEEKILNTIALSIFDNYEVNMVMFEIEGELLDYIERSK